MKFLAAVVPLYTLRHYVRGSREISGTHDVCSPCAFLEGAGVPPSPSFLPSAHVDSSSAAAMVSSENESISPVAEATADLPITTADLPPTRMCCVCRCIPSDSLVPLPLRKLQSTPPSSCYSLYSFWCSHGLCSQCALWCVSATPALASASTIPLALRELHSALIPVDSLPPACAICVGLGVLPGVSSATSATPLPTLLSYYPRHLILSGGCGLFFLCFYPFWWWSWMDCSPTCSCSGPIEAQRGS